MAPTKKAKPYKVSYTKLATFRRCRQQYHWKYFNGYYTPSSVGQSRGTAGHSALAVWHKTYNAKTALQAAWDKWIEEGHEDGIEWKVLEECLGRYFVWSKEHDTFKLLESEKEFSISYKTKDISFLFGGFIDGIVEENGQLYILENKFYKRMTDPADMNSQYSLYMIACRAMKFEVQGVIFNLVRVADTKVAVTEPAVRKRTFINSAGLDKIEQEMIVQVKEMQRWDKEKGVPYRNITNDCSWDCSYHQACLSMYDDGMEPVRILQALSNTRSETNGENV